MTPRAVALECLLRWEAGKGFAETILGQLFQKARLSPGDRHLAQAIVFGVLRHKTWLDSLIASLRKGKLDQQTRIILETGMCQIFVMGLAEHAAVFETVNLATVRARGVVNGILRNAIRSKDSLLAERDRLALHVRFSTPEWLIARWEEQFGRNSTIELLEWNNTAPILYVRRNPLVKSPVDESDLVPLPGVRDWFRVEGNLPLDAVQAGALYVADPSTRHAIDLLAPQAGERILDACAAPGGKSAAIMAATGGQAVLTATDLHMHRLPTLQENLTRLGAGNVDTACMDWTQPCPPCWERYFDAVLLDVPCSNTGVMQRRVDVRWRLSEAELERLATLQSKILDSASRSVRPGGRLVYSTCSIDRDEDARTVQAFLQRHPEFTLKREVLALPFEEKTDGAYAALLIRA